MKIIGIDPGPEECAAVCISTPPWPPEVEWHDTIHVGAVGHTLHTGSFGEARLLVVEDVKLYGVGPSKPVVGDAVLQTAKMIGRLQEAAEPTLHVELLDRRTVKRLLCGTVSAKDQHVRQAIIDLYGGTKRKAIGLKATPGPLYGLTSHHWSALAVAIAWCEKRKEAEDEG